MALLPRWYAYIVPLLTWVHLHAAPYTKVEESFNIQAIHDFIQYGIPLNNSTLRLKALYDHMTFPGAVPRTFVGALVVAGLSKPFIWLQGLNGFDAQTAARTVLAVLNASAMINLINSIEQAYGDGTARWYTAFLASQFHVFFYASRTLPNMFAFCLSTFATASFLADPTSMVASRIPRLRRAFFLLTIAAVIFRSELALLIASHAAWEIVKCRGINSAYVLVTKVIIPAVFIAGVASVLISAPLDTYLWQSDRWLLPELSAFMFNIFPKEHQGASAWGISPWHWYFTSAIPRMVAAPFLLLIPYGLIFTTQRSDTLNNLIPPLGYTIIYSILPHKETRFLFPIIPQLTLAIAIPASLGLSRTRISRLLTVLLAISIAFMGFISHAIILPLSAQSYPGGHALAALHEYHAALPLSAENLSSHPITRPQVHVHLTNLALQSGITRFLEQPSPTSEDLTLSQTPLWIYDKSPTPIWNIPTVSDPEFWSQFDYAIIESPSPIHRAKDRSQWSPVISIPALRRSAPQILGPDSSRGFLVLSEQGLLRTENDGLYGLFRAMYGHRVAWWYAVVYDVLREGYLTGGRSLTGGYWIDWGLEERLIVMKRDSGSKSAHAGEKAGMGMGWNGVGTRMRLEEMM